MSDVALSHDDVADVPLQPQSAPLLPAGLPQSAARSRERDEKFKMQAWTAFEKMGLTSRCRLPQSQVLARSPTSESNLDKCPLPLWELIQEHGGYVDKGRYGVSRGRIVSQLRQWKKARYQSMSAVSSTDSLGNIILVLQGLVPQVTTLLEMTKQLHARASTLMHARPCTAKVVWTGARCNEFWEHQRNWLILIFAEATCDHHDDALYLEVHTHTQDRYDALRSVLREANGDFDAANCQLCAKWYRKCNCLLMVAWETCDMFTQTFMDHLIDGREPSVVKIVSPPTNAVLPVGSAEALYNIAGAVLFKIKKKSGKHVGVGRAAQRAFTVFAVSHSLTQNEATEVGLPTSKVMRQQHRQDSLTYVSEYLYKFFCSLEVGFLVQFNPAKGCGWGGQHIAKNSSCCQQRRRCFGSKALLRK